MSDLETKRLERTLAEKTAAMREAHKAFSDAFESGAHTATLEELFDLYVRSFEEVKTLLRIKQWWGV